MGLLILVFVGGLAIIAFIMECIVFPYIDSQGLMTFILIGLIVLYLVMISWVYLRYEVKIDEKKQAEKNISNNNENIAQNTNENTNGVDASLNIEKPQKEITSITYNFTNENHKPLLKIIKKLISNFTKSILLDSKKFESAIKDVCTEYNLIEDRNFIIKAITLGVGKSLLEVDESNTETKKTMISNKYTELITIHSFTEDKAKLCLFTLVKALNWIV